MGTRRFSNLQCKELGSLLSQKSVGMQHRKVRDYAPGCTFDVKTKVDPSCCFHFHYQEDVEDDGNLRDSLL
jgi:hypothetical protein